MSLVIVAESSIETVEFQRQSLANICGEEVDMFDGVLRRLLQLVPLLSAVEAALKLPQSPFPINRMSV